MERVWQSSENAIKYLQLIGPFIGKQNEQQWYLIKTVERASSNRNELIFGKKLRIHFESCIKLGKQNTNTFSTL